jgi:hypothetical protein
VSAFWPLGPNLGRWTFQVWENLHEAMSVEAVRAGPEIAPCLPASGNDFEALVAELASSAARAP